MRKYVAILLACLAALAALPAGAQEAVDTTAAVSIVERINASSSMHIEQPDALGARLRSNHVQDADGASQRDRTATQARVGYRIQVFDDNDPRTARAEAQNRKRMMESRFPEWRSYVQFNSPYWRVKVGDFRSRAEAEAAIEDMRRAFPYMSAQLRLVRDHINLSE